MLREGVQLMAGDLGDLVAAWAVEVIPNRVQWGLLALEHLDLRLDREASGVDSAEVPEHLEVAASVVVSETVVGLVTAVDSATGEVSEVVPLAAEEVLVTNLMVMEQVQLRTERHQALEDPGEKVATVAVLEGMTIEMADAQPTIGPVEAAATVSQSAQDKAAVATEIVIKTAIGNHAKVGIETITGRDLTTETHTKNNDKSGDISRYVGSRNPESKYTFTRYSWSCFKG